MSTSIKEKITIPELKAFAEFFFNAGMKYKDMMEHSTGKWADKGEVYAPDFERLFDELMLGKYNKAIEERGFENQWYEMEATIQKEMEQWDIEKKIKVANAIEDLRKFIITV